MQTSLASNTVYFAFSQLWYMFEQGSHKNLKTEFHDFSTTDLLLSTTPILTGFRMWLWLSRNMHDNHKVESCHSHENKQFHDFSMTSSYFPWLFGKFSYSKTFPCLSMTAIFFQDFPWPWEPCWSNEGPHAGLFPCGCITRRGSWTFQTGWGQGHVKMKVGGEWCDLCWEGLGVCPPGNLRGEMKLFCFFFFFFAIWHLSPSNWSRQVDIITLL